MSEHKKAEENGNLMESLATFIVDKRSLIFLILIIGVVFSAFSTNWIQVENNLQEFLPDDSESQQGLDVMEEQFTTYGTAQVMVTNVSLEKAGELYDELCDLEGVQSVTYDESENYRDVSALYTAVSYTHLTLPTTTRV